MQSSRPYSVAQGLVAREWSEPASVLQQGRLRLGMARDLPLDLPVFRPRARDK